MKTKCCVRTRGGTTAILATALLGVVAGSASAQGGVPYGNPGTNAAPSVTGMPKSQIRVAPSQPQRPLPYGVSQQPPQTGSPAAPVNQNAPVQVYQNAPVRVYQNSLPPAYPFSLPPTRVLDESDGRSGVIAPRQAEPLPSAGIVPGGESRVITRGRLPQRSENAPVARTWTNASGTGRALRVTTPVGPRYITGGGYATTIYGGGSPAPINTYGPTLLGGYYYGNYCDTSYGAYTYPSAFSYYSGFPAYIYTPGVIILAQPYFPVYYTGYLPFWTPTYQVTYNENTYYVGSEDRVAQIESGGDTAKQALRHAYTAGSFQAAFADIENAWRDGSMALLRAHLPDDDTKISVFLQKKYRYSIATSDFAQITRDALTRLDTVSFDFTRVRKAKNGDVTAYGTHIYKAGDGKTEDMTNADDTVPFDQAQPYDKASDPAAGEEKTVYVSYTLHHRDNQWYIIAVDSSPEPLVK